MGLELAVTWVFKAENKFVNKCVPGSLFEGKFPFVHVAIYPRCDVHIHFGFGFNAVTTFIL